MAESVFNNVKISGISFIIPDNYVYKADDYIHLFENNAKKMSRAKKMVGYGTRYFSPDNITAVDACEVAANDLIENLNIDLSSIDALIFVSQFPDYRTPASASVLHGRLNLPETCAVFDVNQGCTGYVYGLWLASSLIESKACKKVLLLASDNKTKEDREPENAHSKEILIFSSGASATLLEYSENAAPSYYMIGSDGKGYEAIIAPFGGARIPLTSEILNTEIEYKDGSKSKLSNGFMDGQAVFYFSINTVPNHVRELLNFSKSDYSSIDYFAIHQANKQIVETIASDLQLPDDKYSSDTFINYGNMSNISCLNSLIDKKYNDLCSKKIKTALISFGIGLSWASAVIDIDTIYCSGLKFYTFPEEDNKQQLLSYWIEKITNSANE